MALPKQYSESIAELASTRQGEYYECYTKENLTYKLIAEKFGVALATVGESLQKLEKNAVSKGVLPSYTVESGAGVGRIVKKVTTHVKEGEVKQEWVRTDKDAEEVLEQVLEAVRIMSEGIKGTSELVQLKGHCNSDLVSVYPLFDKHYGMMSWGKETGTDYNLAIAEQTEGEIFNYLTHSQPQSEEALIVFGGDYFHCDDNNQVTPSHKNKVDVDGRSFKVFGVGVKMAHRYIAMALERHNHVTVELIKGNHDEVLSPALLLLMSEYYSNNERVTVNANPGTFSYYEFGSTLLAFQHGDKMKQERMYQVVTSDKREAWGRVKYCHTFTGHFHRERTIDIGLMKLESLRTTVPNEAYAVEAGYRSPKTAYAITFSKEGGEIGRTMRNI